MLQAFDLNNNSGTPGIYSRKDGRKPINHERSEDWLKETDQRRNNKGQFTSRNKNTDRETTEKPT